MNSSDKLNLGCGPRYLDGWENLDVQPVNDRIRRWDVQRGLPYPDQTFGLVYLSHVLEHLPRRAAVDMLRECHRVLRRDGVIRVVVPDLEDIVRSYLSALQAARKGERADPTAEMDAATAYEWACIDLLDQLVRTTYGGEMCARLAEFEGQIPAGLRARYGGKWVDGVLRPPRPASRESLSFGRRLIVALRWRRRALNERMQAIFSRTCPNLSAALDRRKIAAYLKSGERHQWMYDDYSLARLLEGAGFKNPTRVDMMLTRAIDAAADIAQLDTTEDGKPYKPHSLYMEGSRGGG